MFFQNNSNLKFCVDSGIVVQEQSCLLPGSGVNTSYHVYQEYPTDNIIKFLFIARLLKDKGTEEYFETAKIIKEKYPNTEFQILGYCDDGKYQTQLDELTKAGVINFLGCATDVRPYIGDVYCTIMPSYHEGLSNVNLESEANGRPVITTKVTGYLCDARSTQDLTDKVEKFINLSYEEKKQMGLNARRKVEREFERQIIVDAYLKTIKILQ